ncbi:MAG TPA: CoA transferase [Solirubrobacteraceae bacterium]|jgi:formyl-CoA transferase|nr:CoA transferase [Solirubrobacteraceae bacterium]
MVADGARGALEGLRVVEFAHVVAGPLAGGLMADLGADVVHVEPPGAGDTARLMGPARDGVHLWWKVSGRNKRSVSIDLRQAEGQRIARELVAGADVAISSLRADTLENWGLDWDSLHAVNDKLVMLQISGYGASSSMRSAPGFGKVGEARSGVVNLTGFPETPPVHTGFSHGDAVTGLMGAFAIMAAIVRRERDEDFAGEWIDLALFESLFRLIEWQVIVHDQLGMIPGRTGNRLAIAPAAVVNTYQSADGEWITITSATQRSVLNVVRMLGLDEKDFATVADQASGADRIDAGLREWVGSRSTEDALRELTAAEVVASRIFTVRDIVEDPIYAELGDIISIADRDLGEVRMQGVIPRLSSHPGAVWRTGAALGEDNEDILVRWLQMDPTAIEALREANVIGSVPPGLEPRG